MKFADYRYKLTKPSCERAIAFAPMVLLLAACQSAPTTDENYQNAKLEQSWSASWDEKRDAGVESSYADLEVMKVSEDPTVVGWRTAMDDIWDLSRIEQARFVNSYINSAVNYIPDIDNHNRRDKWGEPLHTLHIGGDCEDYAFLKALSLVYLEWPEKSCALVIGESLISDGSHAVLGCTMQDGTQIIMDNKFDYLMTPNDHLETMKPTRVMTSDRHVRVIDVD